MPEGFIRPGPRPDQGYPRRYVMYTLQNPHIAPRSGVRQTSHIPKHGTPDIPYVPQRYAGKIVVGGGE
jgi:hypothetical protein